MGKTADRAAADRPRGAMRTVRTPLVLAAALAALTGAFFVDAAAREGDALKETAGPRVEGFRSARFGMSMSETREAIQRDFGLRREDIAEQPNDEDRTSSLVATVPDLFPDSDPAQLVYIHGYRQKKLIQVNILWGSPVTGEPDPKELVTTANVLREYFRQLGFDPGETVMNTRVDDGSFIVFRATDRIRHAITLVESRRLVALPTLRRSRRDRMTDQVIPAVVDRDP